MQTGLREFDLAVLVEEVTGRLAPRAAAAGVRLEPQVAEDVPSARHGDPLPLKQVLTSLVGSAVDALDTAGGGVVAVTVAKDAGALVRFEVGGAPAGAWEGRAEGRLAVCRQLVATMGGELGVRDGAVWFGARLDQAAAGARHRVLIADDSLVNREVARQTLERMGYEVALAGDGAQAVEAVAAGGFAAVLMDCQMPGMDGYEATAAIRRAEGGAHVPVIAMTASATQADRERCLAAGMDDYVSKPFEYAALEAVLARWVAAAAS